MIRYPEYFYIELTKNCNLFCTMCRTHPMICSEWTMQDSMLKKVCEIAFKYAKVVDLRGWGESSLDHRLTLLAEQFKQRGISVRLYTNLNANDSSYWRSLVETGITLAVSIESGSDSLYAKLRRGGSLSRVRRHLLSIKEARQLNDAISAPYFTVVVSEDNIDDLNSIVTLAAETGVSVIELNPISCRDDKSKNGRRTGLRPIERNHAVVRLKEFAQAAYDKNIKVNIAANLLSENSINSYKCIHPWKYVCICSDGKVSFCDHLFHNPSAVMGDLNNQTFEEIWCGDKYNNVRAFHDYDSFDELNKQGIECEWCSHNRYGNSEWLIDGKTFPIDINQYLEKLNGNKE